MTERMRQIPEDLETVRENLLAFSDDIWHSPTSMRRSLQIDDDFYAECNLSANGIRDCIARLLDAFEISKEQLHLFLREDRDAQRESRE